jgi:hypothetical protein
MADSVVGVGVGVCEPFVVVRGGLGVASLCARWAAASTAAMLVAMLVVAVSWVVVRPLSVADAETKEHTND